MRVRVTSSSQLANSWQLRSVIGTSTYRMSSNPSHACVSCSTSTVTSCYSHRPTPFPRSPSIEHLCVKNYIARTHHKDRTMDELYIRVREGFYGSMIFIDHTHADYCIPSFIRHMHRFYNHSFIVRRIIYDDPTYVMCILTNVNMSVWERIACDLICCV